MTTETLESLTAEGLTVDVLESKMNLLVPSSSTMLTNMVDVADVASILTRMSRFY